MAEIYTGPLQGGNTSNWLSNLVNTINPANWFQSTPITDAYNQEVYGPAKPINYQALIGPTNSSGYSTITPITQSTNKSSGGGVVNTPSVNIPQNNNTPNIDPYAQLRGEISSGWDQYLNELNQLSPYLEQQRGAQEGTAKSQYETGVSTLGTQKEQGITTAEQNQTKSLRDIASNLKNAFMAGNVYLGTRGAGDSSAANQYSYALTKEGSRQRGDVMQETANTIKDIQDTYNTGVNQLKSSYDTQINNIANWFAGKQMEIKQAIASGQLNKSQDLQNLSKDILNQALSAMNTAKSQLSERQSALESWAMSNSQNVSQLASNLKGAYSVLPQAQAIAGTPQVDSSGNINVSTGYGGRTSDEIKRLLGLA